MRNDLGIVVCFNAGFLAGFVLLLALALSGCEDVQYVPIPGPQGAQGPEGKPGPGSMDNAYRWHDMSGLQVTEGPQLVIWSGGVLWPVDVETGNISPPKVDTEQRLYFGAGCSGIWGYEAPRPMHAVIMGETPVFRDPYARSYEAHSVEILGSCIDFVVGHDTPRFVQVSGFVAVPSRVPQNYRGPLHPEVP